MMIKIFTLILRLLLGLFFIFSAYSKLFPVEPFEFYWVENGLANWFWAPYLTRLVIAWEFFIGITLLLNVKLKTIILKSALFTLIGFSIYIMYLLITKGANADCGCFGEAMSMKAWPSLAKNVGLIAAVAILLKLPEDYLVINKKWFLALLFIIAFASPFILNVPENYSENVNTSNDFKKGSSFKSLINNFPVRYGKIDTISEHRIVAFFSTGCPHCKLASKKLKIIQKNSTTHPIQVYFVGDVPSAMLFYKSSNTFFPFSILEKDTFFEYNGPSVPSIFLLKNNIVIKHWIGDAFNPNEIILNDKTLKK